MGDEGEDSNEGTGSVDGNDGYDAEETEVRMPDKNGLFGGWLHVTFLKNKILKVACGACKMPQI